MAIAELARGLLSSDSSFVSAVSAPTDASIEASSDAPASLTSTPPTTVSPDNMSQISDADVSGKPDTVSVTNLESDIPLLEDDEQNQAHQQLQQEQQGASQGRTEAQPDAIVVVPQQPADPTLPTEQSAQEEPGPDSTGRFPRRRARGNNAPVYNLARLTGTYVHGKRASKGDVVLKKKRKPKGRKLQLLLAQQALEAEHAAQAALLLACQGKTKPPPDPEAIALAAELQVQQTYDKHGSKGSVAKAPTIPPVDAPTAPELTTPETTVPETTAPETTISETAAPETAAPETATPETAAPETATAETATPEATAPEPTIAETTVAESTLSEPPIVEHVTVEPTIAEPTIPELEVPEVATSPDNGAAQLPDASDEENHVDHDSIDASMHEAPLELSAETAELSLATNTDTAPIIHPYTSDALAPVLPDDIPDPILTIEPSPTKKSSTRGAKSTQPGIVKRPVGRPRKYPVADAGKPKAAPTKTTKAAEPSNERVAEPSGSEDVQAGVWEDIPDGTTGDVQTSPAKQARAVKAKAVKTTKGKATKAGTIKASVEVPATRRATRHSGVPVEDPLLSLIPPTPALGKKTKKTTAEPAVTRVPRELKRLRDTNEFVGIDTRPIRYSVWSNGKYIDVTEEREPTAPPAKKKARVERSTSTVREDKKEKTVEPEAPMNTESSRPAVQQKRVKKWLNKGLYAGQQAPEDVMNTLTRQERKKLQAIPELAKSSPPNKVLPLPIFNGLRLLIAGRDFKLPFDVCHPLPPGQPKPAAYRTMTKSEYILR